MIFLGHTLLLSFYSSWILLRRKIIQIDWVVVLVFKSVQTSVWTFLEKELRQVWWRYKTVLLRLGLVPFILRLVVARIVLVARRRHLVLLVSGLRDWLSDWNLRLFTRVDRVSRLLLGYRWLVLILRLVLLHRKLLTQLLLRSILHVGHIMVRTQVVFAVVNATFRIRNRLLLAQLRRLLLHSVLVCAPYTGAWLWRLTTLEIPLVVLVLIQGGKVLDLHLLEFELVVCLDQSVDVWLTYVVKPRASKALNSCEAFRRIKL